MVRILILEDDPERAKSFKKNFLNADITITPFVKNAIEKLKTEKWDFLFLDHDLGGHAYVESGGEEETGYDVAKFLSNNSEFLPGRIFVHSLNPVGSGNIRSLIDAQRAPFIWNTHIDFTHF